MLLSDPDTIAAIRRVLTRHQPRLDCPRCRQCGGVWHAPPTRAPAGCAARRFAMDSLAVAVGATRRGEV